MKPSTLLVAAIVLGAPLAANATVIVDGSFETKGAASGMDQYCYDGFASPGGPACAASAWVGGGVIRSGSGAWGGTTTPAGSYFGFVQGQSTVSQSFTATGNGTGVISWLDTNRTNNGGLQSYDVTIFDGTDTTVIGSYTSALGGFVARSSSSFALTSGTSYTVSFTGLFDGDRTAFIDDVGISVTPVPEASTWAMLIAGFGLVGFASRRRRSVVAA